MPKNVLKIAGSIILTGVFLYFVFTKTNLDFFRISLDLHWNLAVPVALFYCLALLLKAMRFRFFLSSKISLSEMFSVVAAHSFWNNILPFRSGELSYIYLLRKYEAIGKGERVTSLIIARVFDALVVLIFFVFSAIFLFSEALYLPRTTTALVGLGFVLAALIGSGIIIFANSAVAALFDKLVHRFSSKNLLQLSIVGGVREILVAFSRIKKLSTLFLFFLFSVGVWFADLLFVWTALLAAGLPLSLGEAFFIAAFPVAAVILPLQNPAGLGTFEGVVAGGLMLLGIASAAALSAAFLLHAELILASFLFFCIVQFGKTFKKSRTHTELYASFENPEKDFRNANLSALLLGFAKGKTILDIGSGLGVLLHYAKKRGFSSLGLEPDAELAALSRKFDPELTVLQTSLENYETKNKFDTVFLVDVLECIKDDHGALAKAATFVSPGGRIIISVPAYPAFWGSRDKMLGYHRRYNSKTIKENLFGLGFSVIKQRYWNMIFLLPYFLLYKVLKRESHFEKIRGGSARGLLGHACSRALFYWFRLVENTFNFGCGLTLVLVIEKNK